MSNDKLSKLAANEVPVDQVLERDLYIFLPKNNRTIRVRQRGQYLERHILENYVKKGLAHFFYGTLDPHISQPVPPEESILSKQATTPTIIEEKAAQQVFSSESISEETVTITASNSIEETQRISGTTSDTSKVVLDSKIETPEEVQATFSADTPETSETIVLRGPNASARKEESLLFQGDQAKIERKLDLIKASTAAVAKKIRSLSPDESTPQNIENLLRKSGTTKNVEKLRIAREISLAISAALANGNPERAEELKLSLQQLLNSRSIPAELRELARLPEDEESIALTDSAGSTDPKALGLFLAKEAEAITATFEKDIKKIEANLEEATNSFSIKDTALEENEEIIFSKDETEELLTRITADPENLDPEIQAQTRKKIALLETKKAICSEIQALQEKLIETTNLSSNSTNTKEQVILLLADIKELEEDLIHISRSGDPSSTKAWNNRLSEKMNTESSSLEAQTPQELANTLANLQTSLEGNVISIKASQENIQKQVSDLAISGDRTAEVSSYAAIFALSLGYTNSSFIKEVQMVSMLNDSKLETAPTLPAYGERLFNILKGSNDKGPVDFTLHDGAQIVKMVQAYMNRPNYISGRLKIDKEIFNQLCNEILNNDESYDATALERTRQYVSRGITNPIISYVKELGYEARIALKKATS